MELVAELQRPVYATIGATVKTADTLRQLPDWISSVWQDRQELLHRLREFYEDLAEEGAATVGQAQTAVQQQAREAGEKARRIPGVPAAEGELSGMVSDESQLPIKDYERLRAPEIIGRLPQLSQRELHQVEGYEARTHARETVLSRIDELRGAEPWPGYDEMAVDEILPRLRAASPSKQAEVAEHERRHKQRRTVLTAARS
jgi:hypothetical protein